MLGNFQIHDNHTENCVGAFETSVVRFYYQRLAAIAHCTKDESKNENDVYQAIRGVFKTVKHYGRKFWLKYLVPLIRLHFSPKIIPAITNTLSKAFSRCQTIGCIGVVSSLKLNISPPVNLCRVYTCNFLR